MREAGLLVWWLARVTLFLVVVTLVFWLMGLAIERIPFEEPDTPVPCQTR